MPAQTEMIGQLLSKTVEYAPIGTNLGLLYVMWAVISGQLLQSRGALLPALTHLRLPAAVVRRSWAALHSGGWQMGQLIAAWRQQVEQGGRWQAVRIDGYRVKAGDMSAVFRPRLQQCRSHHHHALSGKAEPAVEVGLCVEVGQVAQQIVPVPALLLTPQLDNGADAPSSTTQTKAQLIHAISASLREDELCLFDPEFKPAALLQAQITHFVVRLASNCVFRQNVLPAYTGVGRPPEYGEEVRPLARRYRERTLAATPSSECYTTTHDRRTLTLHLWRNLVLHDQKVAPSATTFTVAMLTDPRYKTPWLLLSPLPLSTEAWFAIYRFRWTVERPPLIAKQLLGAQRQFFHSVEAGARFFALTLLTACILAYAAALLPPLPTGFWDRNPKPTAGRLRRSLALLPFPTSLVLPQRLRIKSSPWTHLPKGILAHRRSPTPDPTPALPSPLLLSE